MTDLERMHLRVETLEKQIKVLADSYGVLAEANNTNGENYFSIHDAIQSQIISIQILVELLGQEGIVDRGEFEKYKATLNRLVKKQRLEALLKKEVEE